MGAPLSALSTRCGSPDELAPSSTWWMNILVLSLNGLCLPVQPQTILRLTLLTSIVRDLASGRHPPYRTGEVNLATLAGRALMTTTSRRLAWALSIVVAGMALAAPAGAQFAGGRSAFDQRPAPEPVQFRDFFGGERRLGLGQYAQRFAENDINFGILSDLTDQDLKELGVSSLGRRRQLLRAIAKMSSNRATYSSPIRQ